MGLFGAPPTQPTNQPTHQTTHPTHRWACSGPSPPWPPSPRTASPCSTRPSQVASYICIYMCVGTHMYTYIYAHSRLPACPKPSKANPRQPSSPVNQKINNQTPPYTQTNRPPGGAGRLPPPLPPRLAPHPARLHPGARRLGREPPQVREWVGRKEGRKGGREGRKEGARVLLFMIVVSFSSEPLR